MKDESQKIKINKTQRIFETLTSIFEIFKVSEMGQKLELFCSIFSILGFRRIFSLKGELRKNFEGGRL